MIIVGSFVKYIYVISLEELQRTFGKVIDLEQQGKLHL